MQTDKFNLLVRLRKWVHRQDENFLTEALSHLLEHLFNQDPVAGVVVLKRLTGGKFNLLAKQAKGMVVSTQVIIPEGRPDIRVEGHGCLALIEVKVESGLGVRQMERYRGELRSSSATVTCLVLITRYPPEH